jgi:hypothetical protein
VKGLGSERAARSATIAPRAAALLACGLLGGCLDVAADMAPKIEAFNQFERRQGVSLAGATATIVSIDGAPREIAARFNQRLVKDAADREIVLVDRKRARYLVRGYLSADPAEGGAVVDYVWDVFTPDKQRAQRLTDEIAVQGAGGDPWAIVGEAALDSIAGRADDDLAAYLSNTPEARPTEAKPTEVKPTEPASAEALSYAPTE